MNIRTLALGLALLAPVSFFAQAESLNDLRRELIITAVEDSVTLASKGHVTLFVDRENRAESFIRWSYDPRLLFSSQGWVLEFTGHIVRSRPGLKEPVRGYATFQVGERYDGTNLCHSVQPLFIKFRSFVGPLSIRPSSESKMEYCLIPPKR